MVAFHEHVIGAHARLNRSKDLVRDYDLLRRIHEVFRIATIIQFDDAAAKVLDDLHARRTRVGEMDLRMAASAMANGMKLLTRNSTDFGRIDGLDFEDWTK